MGTEARRPPNEFLPANPKPYDYIVFRATEVKDLVVERRATEEVAAAALATVHDDPAVIGVGHLHSSSLRLCSFYVWI